MLSHEIFFQSRSNGRGCSLFTLKGQMLTSRTAVSPDTLTHGCEGIRRSHPTGTYFFCDSGDVRERSGCYYTSRLIPLATADLTPLTEDIFTEQLMSRLAALLDT